MRAVILALLATSASPPENWIGRFGTAGPPPAPWVMMRVKGKTPTAYRVTEVAGRPALEATVNRSMSLLIRQVSVDLDQTPILCWRWYVDAPVQGADMTRIGHGDFAARIYIGFDMPDSALSAGTRFKLRLARAFYDKRLPDAAVLYVWDNVHPVGTSRKSPYTDRMQLVVSEAGSSNAKKWTAERVNLAHDFARAFNNQPGKPIFLALASDGDDTKSSGHAAFADIHFVAAEQKCGS